MTTSILGRLTQPLIILDHSPTIMVSSYYQSPTNSLGSGTKCIPRSIVTTLLNSSHGSKILSSTSMWHSTVCGHATINATTHAMTDPPNRTGTPEEVAEMTHVIVVGIRDVLNVGGITA